MPATTKQAKTGGEFGANGEWYEGGRFINTIPENQKVNGGRKAKPRKVQIEPGVWVEVVPTTQTPLFQMVGTQAEYIDRNSPAAGIRPSPAGLRYYGSTFCGRPVAEQCDRYNAGGRWV